MKKEKGIITVYTSPISPALEESYKFQHMSLRIIGILLLFLLLMITLTRAMYAGETYTHDFGDKVINCSIINNTYNLEGLNVSWNDSIVNIDTDIGYKADNFTLSCIINESVYTEEVVVVSSGGGHSKKKNIPNITENITIRNETLPIIENPIVDTPKEEINTTNNTTKIENKEKISKDIKILIIGVIITLLGIITFILESKKKK